MTEKNEALRLADALADPECRLYDYQLKRAAAELRRLVAQRDALLGVLKLIVKWNEEDLAQTEYLLVVLARAAIAAVEGEKT